MLKMDKKQVCTKKFTLVVLIAISIIVILFYTGMTFYKESYSLNLSKTISNIGATAIIYANKTLGIQPVINHKRVNKDEKKKVPVSIKNVTINRYTDRYESYVHVPDHPEGLKWPEEYFIHDPPLSTLQDTVHPAKSVVKLIGTREVKLGDKVQLNIELFDGKGNKRKGGDLVRVWMREPSLQAASVAEVIDNQDGSYKAIFQTFWAGRPIIRMAVISPREVIATQFRRRYVFPTVLLHTGEFVDPKGGKEESPCGIAPQIPGYKEICNLTRQNYGEPWFCGKPRTKQCDQWSLVSSIPLWDKGFEKQFFTHTEVQLLSRNYQAMIIPHNITIEVKQDGRKTRIEPFDRKCNVQDRTHTWSSKPPSGYLYNKTWKMASCRGRDRVTPIQSCIKNMKIVLIGDSTVRQIFSSLVSIIPCTWGSQKITERNKHTTFNCEDKSLGYKVEYHNHQLPFIAYHEGRQHFQSVEAYLAPFRHLKDSKVVVLIHIFSHFINYHSYIFYYALKRMKPAIIQFLDDNPNATVVFKGAHAYAFELKNGHKFPQKPERYMETYIEFVNKEFEDVRHRVVYLDAADITVGTEQNFIHPEEYVVREHIQQMFDSVCPY